METYLASEYQRRIQNPRQDPLKTGHAIMQEYLKKFVIFPGSLAEVYTWGIGGGAYKAEPVIIPMEAIASTAPGARYVHIYSNPNGMRVGDLNTSPLLPSKLLELGVDGILEARIEQNDSSFKSATGLPFRMVSLSRRPIR